MPRALPGGSWQGARIPRGEHEDRVDAEIHATEIGVLSTRVDGAGGRCGDPADGAKHGHEEGACGELQVVGEQVALSKMSVPRNIPAGVG